MSTRAPVAKAAFNQGKKEASRAAETALSGSSSADAPRSYAEHSHAATNTYRDMQSGAGGKFSEDLSSRSGSKHHRGMSSSSDDHMVLSSRTGGSSRLSEGTMRAHELSGSSIPESGGSSGRYAQREKSMSSPFHCPVPTDTDPSDMLASRFEQYRDIIKELISFFKETEDHYQARSKAHQKLQSSASSVAMPEGFLRTGGIADGLRILEKHNKLAYQESVKSQEIEDDVIGALNSLRSELASKIKEIRGLTGDFKSTIEREMDGTKKAVRSLNESLEQATSESESSPTGKSDPYLLRHAADRQLEKQLREENYLQQAHRNLETSGRELEAIVIYEIQKSYNAIAGMLRRESTLAYNTSEDLRLGVIAYPRDIEWNHWIQNSDDAFLTKIPMRSASDITYPGMDHHMCRKIRSGPLERKGKYLKSFTGGWYVLSPTHLHEFKTADSTTPVMSLYLPDQTLGSHSASGGSNNKFILKGRQTGGLHRGHTWIFRAENYETMLAWYNDIMSLIEPSSYGTAAPTTKTDMTGTALGTTAVGTAGAAGATAGHRRAVSSGTHSSSSDSNVLDEEDETPWTGLGASDTTSHDARMQGGRISAAQREKRVMSADVTNAGDSYGPHAGYGTSAGAAAVPAAAAAGTTYAAGHHPGTGYSRDMPQQTQQQYATTASHNHPISTQAQAPENERSFPLTTGGFQSQQPQSYQQSAQTQQGGSSIKPYTSGAEQQSGQWGAPAAYGAGAAAVGAGAYAMGHHHKDKSATDTTGTGYGADQYQGQYGDSQQYATSRNQELPSTQGDNLTEAQRRDLASRGFAIGGAGAGTAAAAGYGQPSHMHSHSTSQQYENQQQFDDQRATPSQGFRESPSQYEPAATKHSDNQLGSTDAQYSTEKWDSSYPAGTAATVSSTQAVKNKNLAQPGEMGRSASGWSTEEIRPSSTKMTTDSPSGYEREDYSSKDYTSGDSSKKSKVGAALGAVGLGGAAAAVMGKDKDASARDTTASDTYSKEGYSRDTTTSAPYSRDTTSGQYSKDTYPRDTAATTTATQPTMATKSTTEKKPPVVGAKEEEVWNPLSLGSATGTGMGAAMGAATGAAAGAGLASRSKGTTSGMTSGATSRPQGATSGTYGSRGTYDTTGTSGTGAYSQRREFDSDNEHVPGSFPDEAKTRESASHVGTGTAAAGMMGAGAGAAGFGADQHHHHHHHHHKHDLKDKDSTDMYAQERDIKKSKQSDVYDKSASAYTSPKGTSDVSAVPAGSKGYSSTAAAAPMAAPLAASTSRDVPSSYNQGTTSSTGYSREIPGVDATRGPQFNTTTVPDHEKYSKQKLPATPGQTSKDTDFKTHERESSSGSGTGIIGAMMGAVGLGGAAAAMSGSKDKESDTYGHDVREKDYNESYGADSETYGKDSKHQSHIERPDIKDTAIGSSNTLPRDVDASRSTRDSEYSDKFKGKAAKSGSGIVSAGGADSGTFSPGVTTAGDAPVGGAPTEAMSGLPGSMAAEVGGPNPMGDSSQLDTSGGKMLNVNPNEPHVLGDTSRPKAWSMIDAAEQELRELGELPEDHKKHTSGPVMTGARERRGSASLVPHPRTNESLNYQMSSVPGQIIYTPEHHKRHASMSSGTDAAQRRSSAGATDSQMTTGGLGTTTSHGMTKPHDSTESGGLLSGIGGAVAGAATAAAAAVGLSGTGHDSVSSSDFEDDNEKMTKKMRRVEPDEAYAGTSTTRDPATTAYGPSTTHQPAATVGTGKAATRDIPIVGGAMASGAGAGTASAEPTTRRDMARENSSSSVSSSDYETTDREFAGGVSTKPSALQGPTTGEMLTGSAAAAGVGAGGLAGMSRKDKKKEKKKAKKAEKKALQDQAAQRNGSESMDAPGSTGLTPSRSAMGTTGAASEMSTMSGATPTSAMKNAPASTTTSKTSGAGKSAMMGSIDEKVYSSTRDTMPTPPPADASASNSAQRVPHGGYFVTQAAPKETGARETTTASTAGSEPTTKHMSWMGAGTGGSRHVKEDYWADPTSTTTAATTAPRAERYDDDSEAFGASHIRGTTYGTAHDTTMPATTGETMPHEHTHAHEHEHSGSGSGMGLGATVAAAIGAGAAALGLKSSHEEGATKEDKEYTSSVSSESDFEDSRSARRDEKWAPASAYKDSVTSAGVASSGAPKQAHTSLDSKQAQADNTKTYYEKPGHSHMGAKMAAGTAAGAGTGAAIGMVASGHHHHDHSGAYHMDSSELKHSTEPALRSSEGAWGEADMAEDPSSSYRMKGKDVAKTTEKFTVPASTSATHVYPVHKSQHTAVEPVAHQATGYHMKGGELDHPQDKMATADTSTTAGGAMGMGQQTLGQQTSRAAGSTGQGYMRTDEAAMGARGSWKNTGEVGRGTAPMETGTTESSTTEFPRTMRDSEATGTSTEFPRTMRDSEPADTYAKAGQTQGQTQSQSHHKHLFGPAAAAGAAGGAALGTGVMHSMDKGKQAGYKGKDYDTTELSEEWSGPWNRNVSSTGAHDTMAGTTGAGMTGAGMTGVAGSGTAEHGHKKTLKEELKEFVHEKESKWHHQSGKDRATNSSLSGPTFFATSAEPTDSTAATIGSDSSHSTPTHSNVGSGAMGAGAGAGAGAAIAGGAMNTRNTGYSSSTGPTATTGMRSAAVPLVSGPTAGRTTDSKFTESPEMHTTTTGAGVSSPENYTMTGTHGASRGQTADPARMTTGQEYEYGAGGPTAMTTTAQESGPGEYTMTGTSAATRGTSADPSGMTASAGYGTGEPSDMTGAAHVPRSSGSKKAGGSSSSAAAAAAAERAEAESPSKDLATRIKEGSSRLFGRNKSRKGSKTAVPGSFPE